MFSTSALAGRQSGGEAVDCRPPRAAALVLNMSLKGYIHRAVISFPTGMQPILYLPCR
jgi:hypothetical protein